jgi:hypothetical protein
MRKSRDIEGESGNEHRFDFEYLLPNMLRFAEFMCMPCLTVNNNSWILCFERLYKRIDTWVSLKVGKPSTTYAR